MQPSHVCRSVCDNTNLPFSPHGPPPQCGPRVASLSQIVHFGQSPRRTYLHLKHGDPQRLAAGAGAAGLGGALPLPGDRFKEFPTFTAKDILDEHEMCIRYVRQSRTCAARRTVRSVEAYGVRLCSLPCTDPDSWGRQLWVTVRHCGQTLHPAPTRRTYLLGDTAVGFGALAFARTGVASTSLTGVSER